MGPHPPAKTKHPAIGRSGIGVALSERGRRNLPSFTRVARHSLFLSYSARLCLHFTISAFSEFLLPHLTHSFCFPLTSLTMCGSNCTSQFLSIHPLSPWACFSLPHWPSVSSFWALGEGLMAQFTASYTAGYPEDWLPLDTASCNLWIGSCDSKWGSLGGLLLGCSAWGR